LSDYERGLMKRSLAIFLALFMAFTIVQVGLSGPDATKVQAATGKTLILATTTSTKDTGLLDELLPAFKKKYGITVKPIAVGTGEALKMGERGDADVLLVHAPASEEKFMSAKHGTVRKQVMYNYFVIIGPKKDPANIRRAPSAAEAFKRIAAKKLTFVSRGDDSGTNKKELDLWKKAGVKAEGDWYLKTGQGMAATIRIANEKQAYTLADEGTFLVQKKNIDTVLLYQYHKDLYNQYSAIAVNPNKSKKINKKGAQSFIAYLTSKSGQKLIGNFGVKKYGKPLFVPNAKK
jgi:tungstate transport system substrate-binding protein